MTAEQILEGQVFLVDKPLDWTRSATNNRMNGVTPVMEFSGHVTAQVAGGSQNEYLRHGLFCSW